MEELNINSTTTSRFSTARWFGKIQTLSTTVIGLGGIGSYVAFLLSRLNVYQIDLFDGDRVEEVNLAGQLFSIKDINEFKTTAVQNLLKGYSNYYKINDYATFFNINHYCNSFTFCGLDNMEARTLAFKSWLNNSRENGIFIDGRLSAEEFQIFAIQKNDTERIKEYQNNWLFSDLEADATICSYKQTSFVAMNIASIMVNIFVNYVYNLSVKKDIRCVPFHTEFEGSILDLNIIEHKIHTSELDELNISTLCSPYPIPDLVPKPIPSESSTPALQEPILQELNT